MLIRITEKTTNVDVWVSVLKIFRIRRHSEGSMLFFDASEGHILLANEPPEEIHLLVAQAMHSPKPGS